MSKTKLGKGKMLAVLTALSMLVPVAGALAEDYILPDGLQSLSITTDNQPIIVRKSPFADKSFISYVGNFEVPSYANGEFILKQVADKSALDPDERPVIAYVAANSNLTNLTVRSNGSGSAEVSNISSAVINMTVNSGAAALTNSNAELVALNAGKEGARVNLDDVKASGQLLVNATDAHVQGSNVEAGTFSMVGAGSASVTVTGLNLNSAGSVVLTGTGAINISTAEDYNVIATTAGKLDAPQQASTSPIPLTTVGHTGDVKVRRK